MKYIEVIISANSAQTVQAIAEKSETEECHLGFINEDNMQHIRMLVSNEQLQWVLDALQHILGTHPTARITVLPIETTLPRQQEEIVSDSSIQARELLFADVIKNVHLNTNYLILVALSTLVATIGMLKNDVAVVIGAMVIAPLLGPNLALSLGTVLGSNKLVFKAIKTLVVGIIVAVGLAAVIGYIWNDSNYGPELLARTDVGINTFALALASGVVAALSLSTGVSSVMVGVMVAVALLPPAAALGVTLGNGNYELASGAALLLAINIACVNLASILTFFIKGINPRTWDSKEKAKRLMLLYTCGWVIALAILLFIVFKDTILAL